MARRFVVADCKLQTMAKRAVAGRCKRLLASLGEEKCLSDRARRTPIAQHTKRSRFIAAHSNQIERATLLLGKIVDRRAGYATNYTINIDKYL